LCLTVAPTVPISEFIGQLKGGSVHEVNLKLGNGGKVLEWQGGYGLVGVGTKDLPWVQATSATSTSTTPAARWSNGWSASPRRKKRLKPNREKPRKRC
jgi:hypothetical protein